MTHVFRRGGHDCDTGTAIPPPQAMGHPARMETSKKYETVIDANSLFMDTWLAAEAVQGVDVARRHVDNSDYPTYRVHRRSCARSIVAHTSTRRGESALRELLPTIDLQCKYAHPLARIGLLPYAFVLTLSVVADDFVDSSSCAVCFDDLDEHRMLRQNLIELDTSLRLLSTGEWWMNRIRCVVRKECAVQCGMESTDPAGDHTR